jgi:hypothetical protein
LEEDEMQKMTQMGVLALSSLAMVAGLAGPAEAGRGYGMGFSCGVVNNVPRCSGSMRGARTSAGADDYANFQIYSSGTLYFRGLYGGNSVSCSFPSTVNSSFAAAAISGDYNTYFNISVGTDGRCSGYLLNESSFVSLQRP